MPAVVAWRAWYADGSIYKSEDVDWSDLFRRGVIAVRLLLDETPYAYVLSGQDRYFRVEIDGRVVYGAVTNAKLYDGHKVYTVNTLIENTFPGAVILEGETISDEKFESIMVEARSRDFD